MKNLISWFAGHERLGNMLTILIFAAGIYAILNIRREAFPNVDFDLVSVSTVYPGASAEEVEKLITQPIEDSIKEVDGIKEYRSSSIEGRSGIIITIDPDAADKDKVVDDVKSAVDRTEDLPEEVDRPDIREITSALQPIIEMTVSRAANPDGQALSEKEFRRLARQYERLLENSPGVARITRKGWQETEVHVNVDPERLEKRGIGTDTIAMALAERNVDLPGGVLEQLGHEVTVRTTNAFKSVEDIANLFVRSNDVGQGVRLREVATVTETVEKPVILERVGGLPAVTFTVVKRRSADAIDVVDGVKKVMQEFQARPEAKGLKLDYVNDLSYFIKRRLSVLTNNSIQGFLLVLLSLFFFMGWRPAIVTALGIPFAVFGSFIVMQFVGITLNLISMFGLIIVIGMLVDDAIVVCDNIYTHLEKGKPLMEAVVNGTLEVAGPVAGAVATTIFSFAPLMFATGIFGKFMKAIPIVVVIALCCSLLEAYFILPAHVRDIQKRSGKGAGIKDESHWFHVFRVNYFEPFLHRLLHKPWRVVGIFLTVFVIAVVFQIGFGRFKLFPGAIETFQVRLTAERGVTRAQTQQYVEALEAVILALPAPELDRVASRVGIHQKDGNDPFIRRGSHYGQSLVYLTPEEKRNRLSQEIMQEIREKTLYLLEPSRRAMLMGRDGLKEVQPPAQFAHLAGQLTNIELDRISGGPPVGRPVAVRITGDSFTEMKAMAAEYMAALGQIHGVQDPGTDLEEGTNEIRLRIDEARAAQAGISANRIAAAVRSALEGYVATTIRRADETVDVRIRYAEPYQQTEATLQKIYVTNQIGNLVPVSRLAYFDRAEGITAINHLNGRRLVTVTAEVNEEVITSQEANSKLSYLTRDLPARYKNLQVKLGGEYEDTTESMRSLFVAFIVGISLNYILLSTMFRSASQPLIILAAVPFSLIGVIFAFLTHGLPMSFLGFMGVVGLSGVVVNDSIVLVDYCNELKRSRPDLDLHDLVVMATSQRLRAVLLTTITTVLGLLPTAYGIGGSDPFLVPMALGFGWGLAVATLLTLILVPVLYYLAERHRQKRQHAKRIQAEGERAAAPGA